MSILHLFVLIHLGVYAQIVTYLPISLPSFNHLLPSTSIPHQVTPSPPQPPKPISQFKGISINHEIPQVFVQGQVFLMEGKVDESQLQIYKSRQYIRQSTYSITVVFLNKANRERLTFTQDLPYSELTFTIQCHFTTVGKYNLGIFIGQSGKISTAKVYSVIEEEEEKIMEKQTEILPSDIELYVKNNDFFIEWVPKTNLTKISFKQASIEESFIISNDHGRFKVPYASFLNFSTSETEITIAHAESDGINAHSRKSKFSITTNRKINVTQHHFRQVKEDKVQIEGQLPSMVEINSTIKIKGKSNQQLRNDAVIVEPDKIIIQKKLNISEDEKPSKSFEFQFNELGAKEGVYIIEINHVKGYAVINMPVYVGDSYPLLPDYHDLSPTHYTFTKEKPKTLNQKRQLVLKLINEKRQQFNVPPLTIDRKLQALAQAHSVDMAMRGYASHSNLRGEGSKERARKAGIYQPIGENIAVNRDIEYAQYRLARSPIHLKNIINPNWKVVGIGIQLASNQLNYITQEFSTKNTLLGFSALQLSQMKAQLIQGLQRQSSQEIVQNESLSKELENWHRNYGFQATSAIKKVLNKERVLRASILLTSVPYTPDFVELLSMEGYLRDKGKYRIGVTLRVVKGVIEVVVVFY